MPIVDSRVRKGSLRLEGATAGTWQDFSCRPTAVKITPGMETGNTESIEVLCGDTASDATGATRTAALEITAIQDFEDPQGLQAYTWGHDGQPRQFQFRPTADPQDLWEGTVVVQAIGVGGTVAERLTESVTWNITALKTPPRFAAPDPWWLGTGGTVPTGATAGTPGSFTPAGATVPADLAALTAITPPVVASPDTAWTTGQSVALGTGSAHWDGSQWVGGAAS